ncbi:PglL family O-oligosaccharyltransferase [Moraxella lacunata]|nr:Wzy polymerase domain-containing protein [Moraxella lacunata]
MSFFVTKKSKKRSELNISPDVWLAFFSMMVMISFLSPFHSVVVGYDFLAGSFKFILIAFGLLGFYALASLSKVSLSVFTWLFLACWIICQIFLMDVLFPDGMIFIVGALIIAMMAGIAGSNIVDKKKFLNIFFCGAYITAFGSFIIQLMQVFGYQWMINGVEITHAAGNNRFFANLLQPNHLAYVFCLCLCGVIYHQNTFNDRLVKCGLWIIFCVITIGLALTKSRAGVVIAFSVFFVYIFAQSNIAKKKVENFSKYSICFLSLYILSSWFISYMQISGYGGSLGGVGRLTEGGNRLNIAKQALTVFWDNPLFGVGYGNYRQASYHYLEMFGFSENVMHTHNFLTMTLAEMGLVGLLCLLPVLLVIIRAIHTRHSSQSAVALAFVVATVLYSWVEFPLWYFGFLVLFALFLGLVEQKHLNIPSKELLRAAKFILCPVLLMSIIVMEYYIWQFAKNDYSNPYRYVSLDLNPIDEHRVSKESSIFGLSMYNGLILASQTPIENQDIHNKLEIIGKAANYFGTPYYLAAYGQILAYDGQYEKSFDYFKFSCLRSPDTQDSCNQAQYNLQELAKDEPEYFSLVYENFKEWRYLNFDKTGVGN